MQLQNKHKLMLFILAILLTLQFIIVPILTWQDEKLAQIQSSSKRLFKANNVIERLPQIQKILLALQKQNHILEASYYNKASLDTFKLEFQQQIEALFEQYNMNVQGFRWVTELTGELTEVRIDINFKGKLKDFSLFQLALAQQPKHLNIAQWSLNIKKMDETSLGTVNGNLLMFAYNIPKKTKEL